MILKFLIIGFLGLLSVVSPPVFAGILLVGLVSITVCNLDISLVKLAKSLTTTSSVKPRKLPCNFLALGLLFTLVFSVIGFVWGANPQFANNTIDTLQTCLSIALHFGSLMIMIGSMFKFVKLVD